MFKFLKISILSIIAALAISGCGNPGPKDVAESYIDACVKGDAKKLVSLLYLEGTTEQEKALVEGKFKDAVKATQKDTQARGGFDSYKIIDVKEKENKAVVKAEIYFKDGSNISQKIKVAKAEDGKWYLILK